MRCSRVREKLPALCGEGDLKLYPALAAHLKECPACAKVWGLHIRLLHELAVPQPLPLFGDLAPRILARLDTPRPSLFSWRWAAAAAFLIAALALGYVLGLQSSAPQAQPETMAATYSEALSASPYQPVEFASATSGPGARALPIRSAP